MVTPQTSHVLSTKESSSNGGSGIGSPASHKTGNKKRKTSTRARQKSSGGSRQTPAAALQAAFLEELQRILGVERELISVLPKLAKIAGHPQLRRAIEDHLNETREHPKRIQSILKMFGKTPGKAAVTRGGPVLDEARRLGARQKGRPARDAVLIAATQRIEHHEIATYGTLRCWAQCLNNRRAWDLLSHTLQEEKQANSQLTRISEDANLTASDETATRNSNQERSYMPSQYTQRGRQGRERDENGRFENENESRRGRRSSQWQNPDWENEDDLQGRYSGMREPDWDERGSFEGQRRGGYGGQRSSWGENEGYSGQGWGRGNERERDENGRFEREDDGRRGQSQGYGRSPSNQRQRNEYGQFEGRSQGQSERSRSHRGSEEDEDYQGQNEGYNRPWSQQRERDEYGRFEDEGYSRQGSEEGDDYRGQRSSRSRGNQQRERDEHGRFESEDHRRGNRRSRQHSSAW